MIKCKVIIKRPVIKPIQEFWSTYTTLSSCSPIKTPPAISAIILLANINRSPQRLVWRLKNWSTIRYCLDSKSNSLYWHTNKYTCITVHRENQFILYSPCLDIHKHYNCCSCHNTMLSHQLVLHQDRIHGKAQNKLCSRTSREIDNNNESSAGELQ